MIVQRPKCRVKLKCLKFECLSSVKFSKVCGSLSSVNVSLSTVLTVRLSDLLSLLSLKAYTGFPLSAARSEAGISVGLPFCNTTMVIDPAIASSSSESNT